MQLFLIVITAGQIGAWVGPLPYGMAECQTRAAGLQALVDDTRTRHPELDLTFTCEWRAPGDAPRLGDVIRIRAAGLLAGKGA